MNVFKVHFLAVFSFNTIICSSTSGAWAEAKGTEWMDQGAGCRIGGTTKPLPFASVYWVPSSVLGSTFPSSSQWCSSGLRLGLVYVVRSSSG